MCTYLPQQPLVSMVEGNQVSNQVEFGEVHQGIYCKRRNKRMCQVIYNLHAYTYFKKNCNDSASRVQTYSYICMHVVGNSRMCRCIVVTVTSIKPRKI